MAMAKVPSVALAHIFWREPPIMGEKKGLVSEHNQPGAGVVHIRGLIFDLDGTLADNMPHTLAAFRAGFLAVGHPEYTDEELAAKLGLSEEETYQVHASAAWEQGFAGFLEHYLACVHPEGIVVEGMNELLDWLAASGLRIGLVTAGGQRVSALTLDAIGCRRYFHEVRWNGIPAHPKTVPLLELAGLWKLPAGTIAYVGDSATDMQHAREAGLIPLGAAWQKIPAKNLEEAGALAVFSHPSALRAWLSSL